MNQFSDRKIYSVFEITTEIKQALERFGVLWIKGEISNYKHHSSGHMYFSLKDERAQLKAAFFRNNNMYLKFRPEDGIEVVVRGRISVYEPRGDYQIIVEYMEPVGLGTLQLAFEQLKQRLRQEGLFDEEHKAHLPLLPEKVGVVTSPTGAAIQDMLRILNRRNASLDILIYPARVQGAGAAEEIAAGVKYFNTRSDIDVIIVARGGGSMEDLWAFNEEIVARAIYASDIPVISAVGHEVDFTISDFVADLRAPTPSAAAEMVSGAREDLQVTVQSFSRRALQAIRLFIERRRSSLERLGRDRAFNILPNEIRSQQQRLDDMLARMNQGMTRRLTEARHRERMLQVRLLKMDLLQTVGRNREILEGKWNRLSAACRAWLQKRRARLELNAGRLNSLSPLAILERGYAVCRSAEGAILRNATAVTPGDRVQVTLAHGDLGCRVEDVKS